MQPVRYLMDHGFKRTRDYAILRASTAWNEWRLSIDTKDSVHNPADLGIQNTDCHPYDAISYSAFKKLMKNIVINKENDVFVDYGAGKGRVVVLAARYPFKRVVGVELSSKLAEAARENVSRAGSKLECQVEIVQADAVTYPLPDEASVLHFFNPFRGDVLLSVFRNIKESLLNSPRPLTILFGNADHFEEMLRGDPALNNRIISRRDVLWPHYEQLETRPDSNRYRVYRI